MASPKPHVVEVKALGKGLSHPRDHISWQQVHLP